MIEQKRWGKRHREEDKDGKREEEKDGEGWQDRCGEREERNVKR